MQYISWNEFYANTSNFTILFYDQNIWKDHNKLWLVSEFVVYIYIHVYRCGTLKLLNED